MMNGLHHRLPREEYDRLARANFSKLKLMERSAAHYAHALIDTDPGSDAMKSGRVTHMAVFEPDLFRSAVAVWPAAEGIRRGKKWDAFRLDNRGREIVTEAEYKQCVAIQRAVRSDARAAPYVSQGRGEVTMVWEQATTSGILLPCKGRIDFDGATSLVDLKTCADAAPEAFMRAAYRFLYHAQAAWYRNAYAAITGVLRQYRIVAVETTPPYVVQVYRLPEDVLEHGRSRYMPWLDRLALCSDASNWPGYADGELDLLLPHYASEFREDENDDATSMGLEFATREA